MGRFGKTLAIILPIVIGYYIFFDEKFDPDSIRGKRVLVTGASSGIGEQVAYKYAQLGAKLVITARRAPLLEKVAEKCKNLGAEVVHFVPADMSVPEDRKKLFLATQKHLEGLDILILNHALIWRAWWESTPESVAKTEQIMSINFISYVDLTSMFLDSLKQSRGYIGVVSSILGKTAMTALSQYTASKHAVQGFYSSLRQELRFRQTGVSVTLLVYGGVNTEGARNAAAQQKNSKLAVEDVTADAGDAADFLVAAVANRLYEGHFPTFAAFIGYLVRLMPHHTENLATKFFNEWMEME